MKLTKDLREFIALLNDHDVEYVLIGGWAFGYHAVPRYTGDFDFFLRCDRDNARRIMKVLQEFGMGEMPGFEKDFLQPGTIIQFGMSPNRIDILTEIDGVSFEEVWDTRVTGLVDDVEVPLISRESLIKNKIASARPKDLADVDALRKMEKGDG